MCALNFVEKCMWKIILLVVWGLFSFNVNAKVLDVHGFELDNGLKVAVVSNHKAPVGMLKIYYKVGAVNDPVFKGGIAHLLEHMMFRGTKKVKDKEFNLITEENGAVSNAYTTYSHTGYYEFLDVSKLELMLALEADRMKNIVIDDQKFIKERDVVLEERMQRFETNPVTKFYEQLNKVFWQKHPYSRPVSGEIEEIKGLEKQDALDFYKNYYRPDNAIMVIAGDIVFDEARSIVSKYFSNIKNKGNEKKVVEMPKLLASEGAFSMKMDGVNQPRFVSYWHLGNGEFSKKEILALEYFSEYLSGDDTAYLYDKLIYKDKKFLSIGVSVDYDDNLGGKISFFAVPKDGMMSIDEMKDIILGEIEKGIDEISQEKLEEIKSETLSDVVYMLENPQNMAEYVGAMMLGGYSFEEIMNYDEMIKDIEIIDIKNAWNKVLNADRRKIYSYLTTK